MNEDQLLGSLRISVAKLRKDVAHTFDSMSREEKIKNLRWLASKMVHDTLERLQQPPDPATAEEAAQIRPTLERTITTLIEESFQVTLHEPKDHSG